MENVNPCDKNNGSGPDRNENGQNKADTAMSLQTLKMEVGGRKAMSVKRCLFGVDHEANKRQLDALNALLDKRDQDTWDFNFARGTPIANPKRYNWEPVTTEDNVPVAYRLPVFRRCSHPTTTTTTGSFPSNFPRTGSPLPAGVRATATNPPAPVAAAVVSSRVSGEENVNPTSLGGQPTTTTPTSTPTSTTPASPVQSAEQTTCPAFSNSTPSTLQRKRKRSDSIQSTIPDFFTQRKRPSVTAAKRRLDL